MSVVASIDSANWVSDMPSLYPIGFSALITGYLLSRVQAGTSCCCTRSRCSSARRSCYLQLMAIVPGRIARTSRTDNMLDRMYVWWSAVTQNGISTDTLPFIVLTLVLTWLGAYFSSWAIFRWRNPWLGLMPGGSALMWNISFIPGQFSYSFVVFVFAAVLLVMRLHVARKEREWERGGIAYPEFISLSALNVTFWVTLRAADRRLADAARRPLGHRERSAGRTSPRRHAAPGAARARVRLRQREEADQRSTT